MTAPSGGPPSVIPGAPAVIPGAPASVPRVGTLRAPAVQLRDIGGRWVKGGYGWEWNNLPAFIDLPENFGQALLDAIELHLEQLKDEVQAYAQATAPWTDRTGDARRGLKSLVIRRGEEQWELLLGGSVDYQAYLENHNGGEYAVIQPTLNHFAPMLMAITDSFSAAAAEDIHGRDG